MGRLAVEWRVDANQGTGDSMTTTNTKPATEGRLFQVVALDAKSRRYRIVFSDCTEQEAERLLEVVPAYQKPRIVRQT